MSLKKIVTLFLSLATLLASFAFTGNALAASGCGGPYQVQWGDTLASVAYRCGTSQDAIRQANPNLRYWLYAGQTISMPGNYGNNNGYNNGRNGYNDTITTHTILPRRIMPTTMHTTDTMDTTGTITTHTILPRSITHPIMPRRQAERM